MTTGEEPRPDTVAPGMEAATTLNGLDIALAAQRDDALLDSPSRRLIGRQTVLVDWQITGERFSVALKAMTALVGLGVAIMLGLMAWTASRASAVVVEVFEVPPALAERGLTGQVVAHGIQDAIANIQVEVQQELGDQGVANAWTRDLAVQVPQTGVSIGEIDQVLRATLGKETFVSGAVVSNRDGTVSITARASGIRPRTFTGPEAALSTLTVQAAEYLFSQFQPVLYATYLSDSGRFEDALAFFPDAYAAAPEALRPALANNWGTVLGSVGQDEAAIAKYRLSLSLNPTDWTSWANLIGSLYTIEGEQGAWAEGQRMMRAVAANPGTETPEWANYDPLVQNWPRLLDLLVADRTENGGEGVYGPDTASMIADIQARLHDWAGVERYLALAPAGSAVTRAARLSTQGDRALATGDVAGAVAALTAFNALWEQDLDVQFVFGDGRCRLGLALGRAGRAAEARRVLAGSGRWVACQAYLADVIEMGGDRRAADAAYGQAIALAPDLPFAYHRRGLALMARGEPTLAAGRFKQAHERGPQWADPLKGWGDALAAQGLWTVAEQKYARAAALAPAWRELRLAHAVALERVGRREDAAKVRELASS